jgi:hypothetical protein
MREAKRMCDDVTSRKGGDEINDNELKEDEGWKVQSGYNI